MAHPIEKNYPDMDKVERFHFIRGLIRQDKIINFAQYMSGITRILIRRALGLPPKKRKI